MKDSSFAIKLSGVSKQYVLHHEKPTLIENIFHLGKKETIWALKDINLEIKKGERIGIIGDNGSGKTTLLKIISGITCPTRGKVVVNGKIATLIGMEAGFHPELSGEENTYLSGLLLGMNKKEIKNNLNKIITFSGIGKFFDAPLYTYSSGMKLRLGFSIAIHSDPDIFLIDELLDIGDRGFRNKAFKAIKQLYQKRKTILHVSHNFGIISEFCQKVICFEKGKIKKIVKPQNIIAEL